MRELLIFSNRWCCYNETIDREFKSVYSSHLVSVIKKSLKRRLALDIGPERGSNLHSMLWQVSLYSKEIKWKSREMMGRYSNFWGRGCPMLILLRFFKRARDSRDGSILRLILFPETFKKVNTELFTWISLFFPFNKTKAFPSNQIV